MRKALLLVMLVLSYPAWPTDQPPASTLPLTREEIVSTLGSSTWYQGSDVADAIWQVVLIARVQLDQTAKAAAEAAVAPYKVEVAKLRLELTIWKVAAFVLGAAAVGAAGALVAGALK